MSKHFPIALLSLLAAASIALAVHLDTMIATDYPGLFTGPIFTEIIGGASVFTVALYAFIRRYERASSNH